MLGLIERLDLVAGTTDAPILLLGEAGTGKSALAARLHELKLVRRRVKGRLVQVNCATLRDGALPALLGQRRAAMAAAGSERPGFLREADGGVLFLDQIDELPPEAQAALLQALETGRYCPVGSEAETSVRLQLIASASLDPGALVKSGRLRADLHSRLSQWQFRLPALRERREDIEAHLLHLITESERYLGRQTGFNADALARYLRFARDPAAPWPGNLRDLQASEALQDLLARVLEAREQAAVKHGRRPVFLKISPDLSLAELDDVVAAVRKHPVDALVVSNTTLSRPALLRGDHAQESGGLSGKPLFQLSTLMLKETYRRVGKDIPLIGVGGVDSAEAAWAKITAGASLVQLYTGLVYKGFGLVGKIKSGLRRRLSERGCSSIAEVVGSDAG